MDESALEKLRCLSAGGAKKCHILIYLDGNVYANIYMGGGYLLIIPSLFILICVAVLIW